MTLRRSSRLALTCSRSVHSPEKGREAVAPRQLLLETLEHRDLLAVGPIGAEFQIHSHTTGSQNHSSIAMSAAGDFVVVWQSNSQDGDSYGVYAQRYSATGAAVGSEFQVNTYTTNAQYRPTVAMDDDGDFVVMWEGLGQDGDLAGIFAQRYNAAGAAQGSEFQVNVFTTHDQYAPAVAMDADGNFVATWISFAQEGTTWNIYARRYDAAGVALGGEFRVNTFTTGILLFPTIGMDASGDFVVAWQREAPGSSNDGIFARRFDATGTALGGEFRVSAVTTGLASSASTAMDEVGNFIVAWESNPTDGSLAGIYARRYNSAGVALGSEFLINTYTTGAQGAPAVAMSDDGEFVVSWKSDAQDGDLSGIYAQRYDSSGLALGSELLVNSYTTGAQDEPAIAMRDGGNFVIAWESSGQDGNLTGVYGQRFGEANTPPSADAGGPYLLTEGQSLNLDASASTDPDFSDILTFSWDVNGDGIFGDATGMTTTLSWAQLVALGIADGPNSVLDLRVQVSDGSTTTNSLATTLTLTNAIPTATLTGPSFGVRGQSRIFSLSAVDPSPVDQSALFTFELDWDGNGTIDETILANTGTQISHVFATQGIFNVRIRATDKDGGVGTYSLTPVTISAWALQADPNNGSINDLHWGGTNGIDAYGFVPGLVFTQAQNNQFFPAPLLTFLPSFNGKIYVYGQSSNDLIFADITNIPLVISGGDGDDVLVGGRAGDTIHGGNGNDIIFGGTLETDGADLLIGGAGNDLLIGHWGADSLQGGSGSDLLIAGALQFSSLPNAIFSIQSEWLSARPLATKVENITGIGSGPRDNGDWFLLAGVTAVDDGVVDEILGEGDEDWLLYDFSEDLATDFQPGLDAATDVA